MTKEELEMHHYNMWNFIVDTIIETNSVVSITTCKETYCKSVGLHPKHFCFMCEFAYSMRSNLAPVTCDHCPSVLEMTNDRDYCLSGVYMICCSTSEVRTQVHLARLIRDSWKD